MDVKRLFLRVKRRFTAYHRRDFCSAPGQEDADASLEAFI